MPVPRAKMGEEGGELEIWRVCVSGAAFEKVVGLWALAPREDQSFWSIRQPGGAQLHSKQVLPQLSRKPAPLHLVLEWLPGTTPPPTSSGLDRKPVSLLSD